MLACLARSVTTTTITTATCVCWLCWQSVQVSVFVVGFTLPASRMLLFKQLFRFIKKIFDTCVLSRVRVCVGGWPAQIKREIFSYKNQNCHLQFHPYIMLGSFASERARCVQKIPHTWQFSISFCFDACAAEMKINQTAYTFAKLILVLCPLSTCAKRRMSRAHSHKAKPRQPLGAKNVLIF